jgi:2-amino-4-hydroxy-6-hydroxymethyldihydropteridine diphosphokinase
VTIAYLGIGSNVGDRLAFCRRAVTGLESHPEISVDSASSLYETSPVGPPQRSFVNMVVRINTELDARSLMDACKSLEIQLGREPVHQKWGPRVIDIDILLFGDDKIIEPDLEIPHPHMTERRFVLVPLLEIDPDVTDPWGASYRVWLEDATGDVDLLEPFFSK